MLKLNKKNILGDIRAEEDRGMLDVAFYVSPDFRTLIESSDSPIVVGRRGTGKSAIVYNLQKHFSSIDKTEVLCITPEEDQIIGMRPLLELFGYKFAHIKRGALMGWKYAIYLSLLDKACSHYKARNNLQNPSIEKHLSQWRKHKGTLSQKLRIFLKQSLEKYTTPEERIASLAHEFEIKELEVALNEVLSATKYRVVVLVDQVDEGYEADDTGVALVDGIAQAVIDINDRIQNCRANIFLRDNIFRAVALKDPDYSRNIEGQVLRLHWDDFQLFSMACNRLRAAFNIKEGKDVKVWNQVTSQDVCGMEGFRRCLQFTLYRPRDVLHLLNTAFFHAFREGREVLANGDVEFTAKTISSSRLDDLKKEYTAIFPSLPTVIARFENGSPEFTVDDTTKRLAGIKDGTEHEQIVQQDLEILKDPIDIIRNLYSIGFLGLYDETQNNFMFCHDGRTPTKEFVGGKKLLVHPCYWMGLNLTRNALNPEDAEVIYDEYDIRVASDTPAIRAHRLGSLIADFDKIPTGASGAVDFEDWCLEAVKIIFAGALSNIELHPNKTGKQRRDIVATNLSKTEAWKRILEDYTVRHIVFEVKNFQDIGADEYRQVLSYLNGFYGRLGFIITRDESENLRKDHDLEWMRTIYHGHKIMVIKLTGKWLARLLSKLRSPPKHDVGDRTLNMLLDQYEMRYLGH